MDTQYSFIFPFLFFKAEESIDQLVYVCATDQEEVRDAAKQALLVLGNNMFTRDLQWNIDIWLHLTPTVGSQRPVVATVRVQY